MTTPADHDDPPPRPGALALLTCLLAFALGFFLGGLGAREAERARALASGAGRRVQGVWYYRGEEEMP